MLKTYATKEDIIDKAETILNKSLRQVISLETSENIEVQLRKYKSQRKGLLGDLTEKHFFEIEPGNVSGPDFKEAGVELKTTPLKSHVKNEIASKERLVFSMIPYNDVIEETWKESSFLKKNKTLLLMFYLWVEGQSILDYEFKYTHLLDLLEDISSEDALQIQKDWEYIVAKINRGEAHLLSEGDTYYLGACTKAKDGNSVRTQPKSDIPAKPRAFSFKQQYINYLIQTKLLGKEANTESIFKNHKKKETIEEFVHKSFTPFIGKTGKEILTELDKKLLGTSAKSYKRLIANRILGVRTSKIEELEKANITLKAITLEENGSLKESISFPAFDYNDLIKQEWENEETGEMSDFHEQLETQKFLFVVFQKQGKEIVLKKIMFWNFPMKDIDEAKRVWEKTIALIKKGEIVKEIKKNINGKEVRFTHFPGMKDSTVAHVRPHGQNAKDTSNLPVPDLYTGNTKYTKHCFWLNSEYVRKAIEIEKDQD